MGLLDPQFAKSENFSDHISEGEPFRLLSVRTVEANTEYGKGEMVLLTVQGHEAELGIWGNYLTAQAKSVTKSDLDQDYKIVRKVVPGFGSGRPVKALAPPTEPAEQSF